VWHTSFISIEKKNELTAVRNSKCATPH